MYANIREMLAKNENCDRPKYEGVCRNTLEEERERFGSIEKASSFWRGLWEGERTGNSQAAWLDEVRHAILNKVPPPTEEDWTLETAETVGVLKRKKNWSSPGPDRLVNFWWKRVYALHEGVAWSFEAISRSDDDYPSWFAEGRTSLIPKPGEFTIDNQRLITCVTHHAIKEIIFLYFISSLSFCLCFRHCSPSSYFNVRRLGLPLLPSLSRV